MATVLPDKIEELSMYQPLSTIIASLLAQLNRVSQSRRNLTR